MTGMRKRIYVVCGSILLCMAVCLAAACTSSRDETVSGKGSDSSADGSASVNDPNGSPAYDRAEVYRDSTLGASVVYANDAANGVQAYYEDGGRSRFIVENDQIRLAHGLTGYQEKRVAYLENAETGNIYLENTMEPYLKTSDGSVYYAGNSQTSGRMNTTRLGYYYYETHIRDLGFGRKISADEEYVRAVDVSGFTGSVWLTNDMSAPSYENGTMSVRVTDTYDPYVYRAGIDIPEEQYNAIEVTLKTDGASNTGELFFFTDRTNSFNAQQRVPFSIINDGEYHTYLIDLSAAAQTGGRLRGIRFDIGSGIGETVTFRSIRAVKTNVVSLPFKLDATFHTYPDKLHQEYRFIATDSVSGITEAGLEVKLPEEDVASFLVHTESGRESEYGAYSGSTVRFAAFDMKNAGIVGFIIPNDGLTSEVSVTAEDGFIVFRQKLFLSGAVSAGGEFLFGNRLYTDSGHSYSGIETQAEIERNPLVGITVSNAASSGCRYVGYDKLRGAYHFTLNGSDFNTAYYREPNKHFTADIRMEGDEYDRIAYIWMNSTGGCLESAAILDDRQMQVPIPVEVCKNFTGEIEEPFYDPADTQYGDSFYPIRVEPYKSVSHTSIQLYQNWGKFPLKQISSIQFHISYYHLSTGVTESNCIAPYFVYGKDEWTLPDFRGCSGNMWASQPQFNAVGRLRFVSYQTDAGKVKSEYTGTEIRSAGPVYADMDYSYLSDCGSYEYTLRHLEFPQDDENRTYYTLELTFLKDLTVDNVKENFTLFSMDGRAAAFRKLSYLDASGAAVYKDLDLSAPFAETLVLGKEAPFFSYFGLGADGASIMNFAYIVKDYEIMLSGEKWDGNLVLRNTYDGSLNYAYLSFDAGDVAFRKGDSIQIHFILLPWGDHNDTDDANVRYVREDSALRPVTVTARTGSVAEDAYLPNVRAESNAAEFTVTGGRNRNVVRIDGFTVFGTPVIYEVKNGTELRYDPSYYAYDGYCIHYNEDGTYGYSFVYEMDSPEEERTFRVEIR